MLLKNGSVPWVPLRISLAGAVSSSPSLAAALCLGAAPAGCGLGPRDGTEGEHLRESRWTQPCPHSSYTLSTDRWWGGERDSVDTAKVCCRKQGPRCEAAPGSAARGLETQPAPPRTFLCLRGPVLWACNGRRSPADFPVTSGLFFPCLQWLLLPLRRMTDLIKGFSSIHSGLSSDPACSSFPYEWATGSPHL